MIAVSLGIKPIIVELAQAVEEGPEYFKLWDPTKLKEVSFKDMCEFVTGFFYARGVSLAIILDNKPHFWHDNAVFSCKIERPLWDSA